MKKGSIMIKEFCFNLSTYIEFGAGRINWIGSFARELNGKRALIVTDKGISGTPIINRIKALLCAEDFEVAVYDDVKVNPKDTEVQKAADFAREKNIDLVVGCGGGSSMDMAKAVAALLTHPGDIHSIMKPNKLQFYPAPLICIPTTAGTGSEVTSFSVITIEAENRKSSIFDSKIRPDVAIVDPDLLMSVPASVAAATGMDALTHAIEAYTCRLSNPITDGIAIQAIKYIAESIIDFTYVRNEENSVKMMAGSLMAGIAFGFSDIAGVHCMAEALGGMYDTPHGVANAIFLPVIFEYNMAEFPERHRDIALALGIDAQNKSDDEILKNAAAWLKSVSKELKIPALRDLGYIEPEKFDALAELCMKNVSVDSNCRSMNKEDFKALYQKAYEN